MSNEDYNNDGLNFALIIFIIIMIVLFGFKMRELTIEQFLEISKSKIKEKYHDKFQIGKLVRVYINKNGK